MPCPKPNGGGGAPAAPETSAGAAPLAEQADMTREPRDAVAAIFSGTMMGRKVPFAV